MIRKKLSLIFIFCVTGSLLLVGQAQSSQAATRIGGWVDAVVFTEQPSAEDAITQLINDEIDIYGYAVSDPVLFNTVIDVPDLAASTRMGSYTELTLNPYGPTFNDGRLNPFSNPKIREALNWLIDRDYIVNNMYSGLAIPKLLTITATFPEYDRYFDTCKNLEIQYAHDPDKASQIIQAEMLALGAVKVNGKWSYNGQPVTIILIIRTEDERRQIGDYVAGQLEKVGFTTDSQYKTRSEANPIWNQGNPAEGLFHIYTGGWVTTSVSRDDSTNFGYFYTSRGGNTPLWQSYQPSAEFDEVAGKLWDINYTGMTERDQLFTQALQLSLLDSVRVWLADKVGFSPRQADTSVSNDRAGGFYNYLWAYTVRFKNTEGGTMRIAQPHVLVESWNPLAGSNWIYDQQVIRATIDSGVITDPQNGLTRPQRIASASLVVKDGFAKNNTLGWVSLSYAPEITLPDDTWVDWDAASQQFITAAEKYTTTPATAIVKSTVTYPADLFTSVKWHDSSPLYLGDFVMNMILTFDRGKPESPIYDESYANALDSFLSYFKGVRIVSTNPLTIEAYDDCYNLDAEACVNAWWPNAGQGPLAWHTAALGVRADSAKTLAFSVDKANALGIEWMNFIGGASLDVLKGYLNQSASENYIPYSPTMSQYVTSGEAGARWANLQAWAATYNHFWLGTGPYYLYQASSADNRVELRHNPDFPDAAGRWDSYNQSPSLELNYTAGAPGSYLTLNGSGYPADSSEFVTINGKTLVILPTSAGSTGLLGGLLPQQIAVRTDANGTFTVILNTTGADEGEYFLNTRANPVRPLWFTLDVGDPTHPQEGTGTPAIVPPAIGIDEKLFLPAVRK